VKKLRWETPARPIPKHPYRDSALLYAFFAVVFVGVTALTGGDVPRSVGIAFALFVIATAYSWWRWRERIRREPEDR
jgi:membrane protein implicated in regulation of membrane protease activity